MDRTSYLRALIGRPWAREASCWHLAVEVERDLFGRALPLVDLPTTLSWRWMIGAIESHPEHANWRAVVSPLPGLITAGDGALVLMARADRPAHVGIWLKPEQSVLHADQAAGVVLEAPSTLRARGWVRLRFYEPI